MSEIRISLYHPDLNVLSDTTFRRLLSELSRKLRAVQVEEVDELIGEVELSSQKDVVRKRFEELKGFPDAFYLERLSRGSTTLVLILSAMALWMLNITIGESIRKAWNEAGLNSWIIQKLQTPVRRQRLEPIMERHLGKGMQIHRFRITQLRLTEDDDGGLKVEVGLETPPEIEGSIDVRIVGQEFVIRSFSGSDSVGPE